MQVISIPIASYFHFYPETVTYKFIDSKYRIWMFHTWLRWISDVSDDFLYIFVHFVWNLFGGWKLFCSFAATIP